MVKRILTLALCAALMATLIPAAALTASAAAVEGDWTTYRFADEYDDEDEEYICRPEAGYKYTAEGFTVVPADYTDTTPRLSVMSREKRPVKDGLYLQFRVDDFSYDNDTGADEWIALTLTTEEKAAPGSVQYGGGWMALIRGKGDGSCTVTPFLTDPATETFGGTFTNVGIEGSTVALDQQGREIYTLEITWDGSAYEMKLNGTVIPGSSETTALLERLDPNGEFFVGIQMQAMVKDGTAALTILKCGTTEANATTPVGSDSKSAEQNSCPAPEPADPFTVPKGEPAILWCPDTVNIKEENHCSFTVQEDNTWRVQATDPSIFFSFTSGPSQSCNAEDFPVFGILLRNLWADTGTLWYAAGDVMAPQSNCTVPFSIYDGEFYGDDDEYVFVPIDLSDLWEGRIRSIRLDLFLPEETASEFDICFAGMFRSTEEAYTYASEWLEPICNIGGGCPVHPGQDCECAPATEAPYEPLPEPDTEISVWIPEEDVSEAVSIEEDMIGDDTLPDREDVLGGEGETVNVEDAVDEILAKYGCTGTVGCAAMLIPILAACVLKKKD